MKNHQQFSIKSDKFASFLIIILMMGSFISSENTIRNLTTTLDTSQREESYYFNLTPHSLYITHGPISIQNDAEFEAFASLGNGTFSNPYVIENYNITTSGITGIQISYTSSFFLIRNCWVTTTGNSSTAISIYGVANNTAAIMNNICFNSWTGIYLGNSNGSTISGNNCSTNAYDGIQLSDSSDVKVIKNTCNNNERGIESGFIATGIHIENNTCNENSGWGIRIVGCSKSFYGGNILSNNGEGLEIYTTEDYWSNNSVIEWNYFLNNGNYGLSLENYYGCGSFIHNNWFLDNKGGGIQAADAGFENLFQNNHWNTWTSPDANGDGIVDLPYYLDGTANNYDNTPLVILVKPEFHNHSDIVINGNAEFLIQASLEGWKGDGTVNNPLIIGKMTFYSTNLAISISNVDLFFTIQNCEIWGGGIDLYSTSNGIIQNNTIGNVNGRGIDITFGYNINISQNLVSNSSSTGICIEEANFINCFQNLVKDAHTTATYLSNTINSNFTFNTIINTTFGYFGLSGNYPESTTVKHNNFMNIGSARAGSSEVSSTMEFGANFGHNWYSSKYSINADQNDDGIIDTPHFIAGGYYDDYPLTSATSITPVNITTPLEMETLNKSALISWDAAKDYFGHKLNYSLYYNASTTWNLIVSEISTTSFQWNITDMTNGDYQIKIVAKCSEGLSAETLLENYFMIDNTIVDYDDGAEENDDFDHAHEIYQDSELNGLIWRDQDYFFLDASNDWIVSFQLGYTTEPYETVDVHVYNGNRQYIYGDSFYPHNRTTVFTPDMSDTNFYFVIDDGDGSANGTEYWIKIWIDVLPADYDDWAEENDDFDHAHEIYQDSELNGLIWRDQDYFFLDASNDWIVSFQLGYTTEPYETVDVHVYNGNRQYVYSDSFYPHNRTTVFTPDMSDTNFYFVIDNGDGSANGTEYWIKISIAVIASDYDDWAEENDDFDHAYEMEQDSELNGLILLDQDYFVLEAANYWTVYFQLGYTTENGDTVDLYIYSGERQNLYSDFFYEHDQITKITPDINDPHLYFQIDGGNRTLQSIGYYIKIWIEVDGENTNPGGNDNPFGDFNIPGYPFGVLGFWLIVGIVIVIKRKRIILKY